MAYCQYVLEWSDYMAIKSHVQLPKCILKHFSESSGRVFYLDVKTGNIGLTSAGVLGTKSGYFSDEQEAYLGKEIESPIARLASKVRSFIEKDNGSLTLDEKVETVLKKYITAAMARSDLLLDTFLSESETADLCTDQQNHDDLVRFSTVRNDGIAEMLKNYFLVVLVNKTEDNLVVPRNCFYTLPSKGSACIVAPISPQCALCLFPPEYSAKSEQLKDYRMCHVEKMEDIEFMNQRALLYEYMYNKTFVASATRKELDKLAVFLEGNRVKLERIWSSARQNI